MQPTQTNQPSQSDLRVLVLSHADIQRLRALLSREILVLENAVESNKMFAAEYRSGTAGKKFCINRATAYQRKVNKLASIQYQLKYGAMYPFNYAIMQNLFYNLED